MALFGSLDSLPLAELLSMLANQEGALEVWNLEGLPPTTLYLKPGRLRHVAQGNRPLDPLRAKAVFQTLLATRKGSFEFIPRARPPFRERLNWPLDKLLLATFTLQDELAHLRSRLHHPEARFRLKGKEPGEGSFLQAALPFLRQGASAREISERLGLPLDLVRYYLYKLEAQGKVEAAPAPSGVLGRLFPGFKGA